MDVYFKVVDIKSSSKEESATLKGISHRIYVDAPISDLVVIPKDRLDAYKRHENMVIEEKHRGVMQKNDRWRKRGFRNTSKDAREFKRPGKILHLDGDEDYMKTCLKEYEKSDIEAHGRYVPEKDQPSVIFKHLADVRPDIVVLTGHDSVKKGDENYNDIKNYHNSAYFVEAVKECRRYEPDMDGLVIFAGACQSMYKDILGAGANFASAPYRVLIHTLDPVLVAEKVALTQANIMLAPKTVISNTITGVDGIGGLLTRGKYREGFPKEPY